jgi:hypothetical protein
MFLALLYRANEMALTAASMLSKIKAARVALAQTSDAGTAESNSDAAMLAFCQGIIDEIVENSELVPVSKDSGAAGAGIITGKVK